MAEQKPMSFRSFLLALGAGAAAAILVGVAVSEVATPWVEFSPFLGVSAGVAAGMFTAAAAYLVLADDPSDRRRRMAMTFVAFGASFLVAILVLGLFVDVLAVVLVAAFVVGFAGGGVVYVRGPKGPTGETEGDGPAGN